MASHDGTSLAPPSVRFDFGGGVGIRVVVARHAVVTDTAFTSIVPIRSNVVGGVILLSFVHENPNFAHPPAPLHQCRPPIHIEGSGRRQGERLGEACGGLPKGCIKVVMTIIVSLLSP